MSTMKLLLAAALFSLAATSLQADSVLRLVEYTNSWRIDDKGVDLGTAWREPNFNDSAWAAGPGLFGYPSDEDVLGIAPIQTPLQADELNPVITYYFRTEFNFPSNTSGVLLVASNLIDDGAVFYLNGVDVGRLSMALGQTHNTLAARNNDIIDLFHKVERRVFPSNSLVLGRNVLAVELHQGAVDSDDAIFGLELLALLPLPPEITTPPESQTTHPTRTAAFSVAVQGRPNISYQWLRNGTNLSNGGRIRGATTASLTITDLSFSDAGDYQVRVSNSFGEVLSPAAVLDIVPDVTGPRLLSAQVNAPENRLEIIFDEVLSASTATNAANYTISSLGCVPPQTVAVSNAVLANDRVTLTIGSYRPDCEYVLTVNGVHDIANPSNAILPQSQIGIRITYTTNIFGMNQRWTFNQGAGFDCATSLGTAWKEVSYMQDDSWGGPVSGILYFDAAPQTPCSGSLSHQLAAGCNAYYFRTGFTLTNIPPNSELVLTHYVDDGAVFYLNGEEIHRSNMPSGTVSYSTRAAFPRDPRCESSGPLGNLPLVLGTNVLAVEVHQNELPGAQGEDISFGTVLDLVYHSEPMLAVELIIQREGPDVIISWTGTGFTLESKAGLEQPAWSPVSTTGNRLVTPASGTQKFFRLRK